jgi:hypothetical protein
MNKEILKNLIGEFTWDFGQKFFIETAEGNFIYSDPDYNGDNTIRPYKGTLKEFFKGSYGRDKGKHFIEAYCGSEFTYVES